MDKKLVRSFENVFRLSKKKRREAFTFFFEAMKIDLMRANVAALLHMNKFASSWPKINALSVSVTH